MNKVFISRSEGNIPWGFRLQGGLEDNEPLTLTNIQPNSPADGKVNPGDMLIEIAGVDVTCMTHKDAIELIRRCGNALFLTIYKVAQSSPRSEQIFDDDDDQPVEFSSMPMVLAKILARPGGAKPFTYTPGNLSLSKLVESARDRRQRLARTISEGTQDIEQIMNRRMIVPPDQMDQHHYAGVTPIIPFSYARQQPTTPKKQAQHDTDVITQSRSFQLLEDWITDSEKTVATLVPPTTTTTTVTRTVLDNSTSRSNSGVGVSSLPSRSFRYLQEQYSEDHPTTSITVDQTISSGDNGGLRRSSDAHTPSRAFKYLQDQYPFAQQSSSPRSQTVNNRDDLLEIYHKLPPSSRAREPEAPRYKGSTVPSRSFRFLQKMTSEDQQDDAEPVSGYIKPQQHVLHKYDQSNLISNDVNRLHDHPSRSFKYLQGMTGEQLTSGKYLSNEKSTSDF